MTEVKGQYILKGQVRAGAPKKEIGTVKQAIGVRLDPDVIAWLRQIPNYNAFLNSILKEQMLKEEQEKIH